jgi:hypothetical protein
MGATKQAQIEEMDERIRNHGYYYFPVELVAWGENADVAWREAIDGFSQDPGPTPEKYDFEPEYDP